MQLNINDSFFDGASDTVLQDMRTMIDRVLVARGKGEKPRLSVPSYMELVDLGSTQLTDLIDNATEARRCCDMLADVAVLAVWRVGLPQNLPVFTEETEGWLLHFTVDSKMEKFEMRALVSGLWGSGMQLTEQVADAFEATKEYLSRVHFPQTEVQYKLECVTDLDNNVIAS